MQEELNALRLQLTEARIQRMEEVLAHRTRHLTVVLENLYQAHNAAAVLRTCDCFGVQDAHIIENGNLFSPSAEVSSGADKWVDVIKYNELENNTEACLLKLKNQGYQIVATDLSEDQVLLDELNIEKPTAIVFGTEMTGISEKVREMADIRMKIPMYGFTQSFNISVSAAIILSRLKEKLMSGNIEWELSEDEKDLLRLAWYKKSIYAKKK